MMLRYFLFALGALLSVWVAGPAWAQDARSPTPHSGRYELDPDHSSITMRVDHLGFSRIVVRFDRVAATLDLDADDPTRSSVDARIEAASISSGSPSFDAFLSGDRFLDAAAHPELTFVSRSIERSADAAARISGELTMNGVTHPVVLDAVLNAAGRSPFEPKYIVGFSATGALSRSQWGLGAFIPMVGDTVEFQIEAEFIRPA
jgi:polyisoprenoid-binding protein YceI